MNSDYTPIYILTWNPKKFTWEDYDKEANICKSEGSLPASWSCRTKSPTEGDRFILLMQGMEEKNGIVGAGKFCDKPEDIGLETEYGKRFAPIVFEMLIDYRIDDYIKTKQLKEDFPMQCWTPQKSGIRIWSAYLPKLWEMVCHE